VSRCRVLSETDFLLKWLLSKGARQVMRSHLCSSLVHLEYREMSLMSVVLYLLKMYLQIKVSHKKTIITVKINSFFLFFFRNFCCMSM
jgi:hypothetical protein